MYRWIQTQIFTLNRYKWLVSHYEIHGPRVVRKIRSMAQHVVNECSEPCYPRIKICLAGGTPSFLDNDGHSTYTVAVINPKYRNQFELVQLGHECIHPLLVINVPAVGPFANPIPGLCRCQLEQHVPPDLRVEQARDSRIPIINAEENGTGTRKRWFWHRGRSRRLRRGGRRGRCWCRGSGRGRCWCGRHGSRRDRHGRCRRGGNGCRRHGSGWSWCRRGRLTSGTQSQDEQDEAETYQGCSFLLRHRASSFGQDQAGENNNGNRTDG